MQHGAAASAQQRRGDHEHADDRHGPHQGPHHRDAGDIDDGVGDAGGEEDAVADVSGKGCVGYAVDRGFDFDASHADCGYDGIG